MNQKVGFKARHGRHGRNPVPHGDHRKRPSYSRVGRLLKQRMALLFAPTVDDFDLDRPRLGTADINSGRAAETAARQTRKDSS
jgi:hypothetical protein